MILAIEIIVSMVTLLSDAYQLRLLTSIINYEYDYLTALNLVQVYDVWQLIIGVIGTAVAILSIGIFLYWFYRAYRNLPSLGAKGLKFNPKWVIAYFFIPILALWKPFRALEEIWIVSANDSSNSTKLIYILLIWWILFVVSNVLGYLLLSGYLSAATLEDFKNLVSQDMVLRILFMSSDVLFIFIAKEICERQEIKSHYMSAVK